MQSRVHHWDPRNEIVLFILESFSRQGTDPLVPICQSVSARSGRPLRCLSSLPSNAVLTEPPARILKMSSSEDDNPPVATPPPNKKGKRLQKYRREGEEANPWLDSVSGDVYKANCKACRRTFSVSHGGLSDIKQHASGEQHSPNIRTQKTQRVVSQFFMTETSSEIDSFFWGECDMKCELTIITVILNHIPSY